MTVKKNSSAKDINDAALREKILNIYGMLKGQELGPDHPRVKMVKQMGFPPGDGLVLIPPDKSIRIDAAIQAPQRMLLPSAVVEHFIKIASHRVIANFCPCRDRENCKGYPSDFGCIFLGDGTKNISPELGRAVTIEECLEYAAKCREAGLVHNIGRNSGDLFWLNEGVGPAEKLMTICNCCPCCCGLLNMRRYVTEISFLSRMPGVEVGVNQECTGCGACEKTCPYDAIHLQGDRAEIDGQKCMKCGKCTRICPVDAIQFTVNATDIQQTIDLISKIVDVR